MYLGRIVEIGPAEDVLLHPYHPYTKALLDVVPEAGGLERPILAGEPPDPTRIPARVPVPPAMPGGGIGQGGAAGDRGAVPGTRTCSSRPWRPPTEVACYEAAAGPGQSRSSADRAAQ